MQGPIAQALALTCVGNAYLRGEDVAGFWPDASVFRFSKSCDFREVDGDRDELIAADPLAWFETLRSRRGLRRRSIMLSTSSPPAGAAYRLRGRLAPNRARRGPTPGLNISIWAASRRRALPA